MPARKAAVRTVLGWVEEAELKADRGFQHELDWLTEELRRMLHLSNYQFFRRVAMRDDSIQLLKWILYLARNSGDRNWILNEAMGVYGSGIPPFQPALLALVRQFKRDHAD